MYDSGLFQFGSHTYDLHNPKYGGANAPDGINGIMREKGEASHSTLSVSGTISRRAFL